MALPSSLPMRLIQALIFILPWVAMPNVANPYLEPKELFLIGGLWGISLWTLFTNGIPQADNPWLKWCALFLLLTGLYHFQWQYLNRTATQQQVVYNVYTWLPTITVIVALLAVRSISSILSTSISTQLVTQWWCLSALLTACYALLQKVGLDQWYVQPNITPTWNNLTGSFGNPEYLSLYLAMLLPLYLLFRPKRYLAYLAILVSVIAIVQIPGTWIIACIGLITYGLTRLWATRRSPSERTAIITIFIIGFLVGLKVIHANFQGEERLTIWAESWNLLQARQDNLPRMVDSFTGRGIGAYSMLMRDTPHVWAHSEWLQSLIELGVIGTGLMLAMVLHTTRRAWKNAQSSLIDTGWFAVWIAWLAASLIFPVAHWAHTAWVGLCAWAILEREGFGYGKA